MNKRRLILVMFALLALGGGISGWWFSQSLPLLHPEESTNVAHAAPGVFEGCTICHQDPISYTSCSDSGCHDAPSSVVGNGVYLKHHVDAEGCDLCHENLSYPGDARYVVVPESGHNFCASCHNQMGHEQE